MEAELPYFKRLPYQEMVSRAQAAKAPAPSSESEPSDSFLQLANSVLAEDAGESPIVEGPFHVLTPTRPGETGRMVLSLENIATDAPAKLRLTATDMHSGQDNVLSRSAIRLNPASMTIPPGGAKDVEIAIHVPNGAKPGAYSGAISVGGAQTFGIQITAEVR